jgi:hypothetical protein
VLPTSLLSLASLHFPASLLLYGFSVIARVIICYNGTPVAALVLTLRQSARLTLQSSELALPALSPASECGPPPSFWFYFFKLTQPLTISVKEKGGKPDRKPYPLPYGLRNPYRNLCLRTLKNMPKNFDVRYCTFMNSASGLIFPSRWNVHQKAAVATLYVLCESAHGTIIRALCNAGSGNTEGNSPPERLC